MRLIDADAVWDRYENESCCVYDWTDAYNWLKRCIDEQPTVDAEPVRHGKWLFLSYLDSMERKCSECGDYIFLVNELEYNYCPHCGAKMDGE